MADRPGRVGGLLGRVGACPAQRPQVGAAQGGADRGGDAFGQPQFGRAVGAAPVFAHEGGAGPAAAAEVEVDAQFVAVAGRPEELPVADAGLGAAVGGPVDSLHAVPGGADGGEVGAVVAEHLQVHGLFEPAGVQPVGDRGGREAGERVGAVPAAAVEAERACQQGVDAPEQLAGGQPAGRQLRYGSEDFPLDVASIGHGRNPTEAAAVCARVPCSGQPT